jgi:hypothetical protein
MDKRACGILATGLNYAVVPKGDEEIYGLVVFAIARARRRIAALRVGRIASEILDVQHEPFRLLDFGALWITLIASASRKSFFCPFESSRTYFAGIKRAS